MTKTRIAALMLCCSLLFAGCDSAEQRAENEKNLKQAEKNAVAYIEEKYGFTPEISDSVIERRENTFGTTPETTAMVRMSYNGKEFSVYIDGKNENTDGADNYQQEEIISALHEEFSEIAENAKEPVGEIKSINIVGGEVQDFFIPEVEWDIGNLYSAYFDGDNFAEVFGDNSCKITADYIEADFQCLSSDDFSFLLSNEKVNLYMVSYRTEKDYQERPDYNKLTDYTRVYAIQIEESLVFEKNETEHCQYTLGKWDNFYYYACENKTDMFSFSKTTLPDAENWNGHGVLDGQFVTPAYRFDSWTDEVIYIYYPLSELTEDARLATYSKGAEGENFGASPLADDIGDYRIVYLASTDFKDAEEISFAFIDEKGE